MLFSVNTKTKQIIATGKGWSIPIPEHHLDFWKLTEIEATEEAANTAETPTHYRFEGSFIWFGKVRLEPPVVEGDQEQEKVFDDYFKFDLKDYKLKSPKGKIVNPELMMVRNGSLYPADGSPSWLQPFVDFWKHITFNNTRKEKLNWLFKLDSSRLKYLKLAEKLYRAGVRLSTYDMKSFVQSIPTDKQQQYADNPWELLNMPKKVFQEFVSDEALAKEIFRYTSISNMASFQYWDQVWHPAQELGKTHDLMNLISRGRRTDFEDLLEDKNYNPARLIEYIYVDLPQKQGFDDPDGAVEMLCSYARMCSACYEKLEDKYPKHLKTEHDVMVSKFNKLKQDLKKADVMKAYESLGDVTFRRRIREDDPQYEYIVVIPDGPSAIADEGKVMHHCVATYIDRLIENKGRQQILFVRTRNAARSSWHSDYMIPTLTLEVYDGVLTQARGKYNREPYASEFEFLQSWCVYANIRMGSSLVNQYKRVIGKDFVQPEVHKEDKKENEVCV